MGRRYFSLTRSRLWSAAAALLLPALLAGLTTGCGGGSSSVVATGFPAGNGTNTVSAQAASGGGRLTLTATNLSQPVFFPTPRAVSDSDPRLQGLASPSGSKTFPAGLGYVPGSAYQLTRPNSAFQFPAAITLTVTFPTGSFDPQTLNIFYYDGTTFQPVSPVAGGFAITTSGATTTLTTTINTFQGTGLYAVLASSPPISPG